MIPKILHYVWVGTKPVSDEAKRLIEGWHKIMPDYEIRCWDNDTIDFSSNYIKSAFAVGAWNRVSDYQRMCALIKEGGVYLDTDVEVRKRFDPLLENSCFLGFQSTTNKIDMVNGAVLGSEKGHSFICSVKEYFDKSLSGEADVGSFSGPGLLTKLLREKGLQEYVDEPLKIQDITVYPCRYFYPYDWEETFDESCVTPDTYSIHLWEYTWKATPTNKTHLKKKIAKRLNKLFARVAPDYAFQCAMSKIRRRKNGL